MKHKIFIDGSEGTTGLKIHERFRGRDDIEILQIDADTRKDPGERRRLINESDVCFLCLPDEAAKESVSLVENTKTVIIDTSTAHRTAAGWDYGFPELSPAHRQAIKNSQRICVPGCHATGAIALLYPLLTKALLAPDYPLAIHSITGYSGGGKKMIADYENTARDDEYNAPMLYALGQQHKHLPEIVQVCGLARKPLFSPVVADYYAGMLVSVPIYGESLLHPATDAPPTLRALHDFYTDYYADAQLINVAPLCDGAGEKGEKRTVPVSHLAGRDDLLIHLTGNDERMVLCAQFDNLGKGASGAAVQCMNVVLGCGEANLWGDG